MKKLLVVCLLLVANSAWAKWVKVAENGKATFYIDPSTIRKDGNFRKVWEIQNLTQRDKSGEMSRRVHTEYDCTGESFRILSTSYHSEPMATGKTISMKSEQDTWWYIPPGSTLVGSLKMVCAK